jgi:nitrogen regulatory protein P-II 1
VKLVTAIVRPHLIEEVKDALDELGIRGMTLSEVRGYGRQGGHTDTYRGAEYTIEFVPKARIDVLCAAGRVEDVIDVITAGARSGEVGDGKVWVTAVEDVVRIRTGEHGLDAL